MSKAQTPPVKFERGFLERLDHRTTAAQVLREQWEEMTTDLGGADRLSLAQRMLIERALWLHYWLRGQEQSLADGGEFDVGKHAAATNTLQGVLAKLGLQRVARDVPDLAQYLKAKAAQ